MTKQSFRNDESDKGLLRKMDNAKRLFTSTLFLFSTATAAAGEYSFGTGAEYTRGDYGTGSDTSALYVPFTLGYSAEAYGWSLTVPYLSVTGTGEVAYSRTGVREPTQPPTTTTSGPGAGTGSTSTTTKEHTESGLGDVTLSASYRPLPGGAKKTSLAITAKIKFATADENRNLGTGENDYALQLELGRERMYGYLGYMLIGDTATTDYNDIVYGAIGMSAPAGRWDIGGEYYAEQAVLEGIDAVSELSVSAGREMGEDNWLKLYLIKGFTDSSPDWGAGVGIRHYF
jgi:hypothetical protein